LIKQAEKLYDEEKYQEAIDLLLDNPSKKDKQNPDYWLWLGWCYYHENFEDNKKKIIESLTKGIKLYEENPKPFTDLKEDIKESKNLIVKAYAKIGLDDINNKKTVEKCCEYILSHIDDCSDFDSFAQAGIFLSLTMPSGYSDFREIDTGLELLQKADDLFDSNVGLDRIEFDLFRNFAFSQKGIQCFVEGDFNNAKVYVEKILASENKIPDDGWFIDLSNIGMFLTGCYTNRHFMNLNDDISSIASVYFHECLKSDEKYFQDGGNLGLGLLNLENEKVALNYFSKISKSNKEINDLRIFFKVIIKLRGKPKDAIKELKSLNNSEVIPKVVVDLFLGAMYFEDNKDEKGTEILNSLSKSEFTGGLITYLPMYDLICCIYLKEEGALEHLKVWTQKYPDSPQYRALYGNGLWEHDYHIEAKFQLERAWELEKNIFTLIPLLKIYTYLGEYKEIESLRTELDNLIETKGIGQNFLAYLNLFNAIKDKKWSMANALAKKISDATDVYINKHLFPMLENLPREYCRSNNRAHFIDMLEGIILIIKKEYGKARNIFQKKENVISLWGMMKVYDAEGKTIEAEGFKQRLEEEVKKKQEDDSKTHYIKAITPFIMNLPLPVATEKINKMQKDAFTEISNQLGKPSGFGEQPTSDKINTRKLNAKKKTTDANFPKKSMSVVDLKKLIFNANENKVEYLLIDEKKFTASYDAPKFWLFWYLGMEYKSKSNDNSWLQFPEKHIDIIDKIWLKWHKVKFINHLNGIVSDYYNTQSLFGVNDKNDLKNLLLKWDKSVLDNLNKLSENQHKTWVIDIKGGNRRNIKYNLIEPVKEQLNDSDILFKKVSSSISHRPSPFKINTNLEIEISFKD
jgi:hypothetical protein